jgi:hypothetical protein
LSPRIKVLIRHPIHPLFPPKHSQGPFNDLGVADHMLLRIALQTKWLWLQGTDYDHIWEGLPLKHNLHVLAFFNDSIYTELGYINRALFWCDQWFDGSLIMELALTLLVLIPPTLDSSRSTEGLFGWDP